MGASIRPGRLLYLLALQPLGVTLATVDPLVTTQPEMVMFCPLTAFAHVLVFAGGVMVGEEFRV